MKKWKEKDLYIAKYPHHFNWEKAMWIVRKDDILLIDKIRYKVTDVKLLPIQGSLPEIIVEQINDD